MIATGWTDSDSNGSNSVSDTEIREIGMRKLSRNWGKMENGPAVLETPNAEADHAPPLHEIEGEVSTILPSIAGLTDIERHKYLIDLLDGAHQGYESAQSLRDRTMVFARAHGVSCHDIAIVLGITESGVRARIRHIKTGDA